ncbi:MAG: NAD(P)H-hydrate dehydratase [Pyrinomonadaceae bacterium]
MSPSPRNKTPRKPNAKTNARTPASSATSNGSKTQAPSVRAIVLTPALLRRWPLPQPNEGGDKEERGRVLVVGGATEMPGAIILAATAALRAGAGKLQIATCRSIAQLIAAAVPEARVFSLPETKTGDIAVSAAAQIIEHANRVQAVLFGPGMVDEVAITKLMRAVLPRLEYPTVILDAAALTCAKENEKLLHKLNGKIVLTPHAGEMANLTGLDKELIANEPLATVRRTASALRAVIALKGAETFIAMHGQHKAYCNRTGNVGLATSGSGDTLSGIITGLAARGAAPLQAAAWGVYLHGRAGDKLAKSMGQLGFLARELLSEIPALMAEFDKRKK